MSEPTTAEVWRSLQEIRKSIESLNARFDVVPTTALIEAMFGQHKTEMNNVRDDVAAHDRQITAVDQNCLNAHNKISEKCDKMESDLRDEINGIHKSQEKQRKWIVTTVIAAVGVVIAFVGLLADSLSGSVV